MRRDLRIIVIFVTFMILGAIMALSTRVRPRGFNFYYMIVILLAILLLTSLTQIMMPKPRPRRRTITVIKCLSCDLRLERNFREGDYALKRLGPCRCGGELYIDMIYDIEI